MFVTVSRKADNFIKKFAKYLSLFLIDVKYIPRGKTPLDKMFKTAIFLGHSYFLISHSLTKDQVSLMVYKADYKKKSYFPDKEIVFKVLDMNAILSKKAHNELNTENIFTDENKLFYFLSSKKKGNYGVFCDDEKGKKYSFKLNNTDLGFFLVHIDTKKFKELKIV